MPLAQPNNEYDGQLLTEMHAYISGMNGTCALEDIQYRFTTKSVVTLQKHINHLIARQLVNKNERDQFSSVREIVNVPLTPTAINTEASFGQRKPRLHSVSAGAPASQSPGDLPKLPQIVAFIEQLQPGTVVGSNLLKKRFALSEHLAQQYRLRLERSGYLVQERGQLITPLDDSNEVSPQAEVKSFAEQTALPSSLPTVQKKTREELVSSNREVGDDLITLGIAHVEQLAPGEKVGVRMLGTALGLEQSPASALRRILVERGYLHEDSSSVYKPKLKTFIAPSAPIDITQEMKDRAVAHTRVLSTHTYVSLGLLCGKFAVDKPTARALREWLIEQGYLAHNGPMIYPRRGNGGARSTTTHEEVVPSQAVSRHREEQPLSIQILESGRQFVSTVEMLDRVNVARLRDRLNIPIEIADALQAQLVEEGVLIKNPLGVFKAPPAEVFQTLSRQEDPIEEGSETEEVEPGEQNELDQLDKPDTQDEPGDREEPSETENHTEQEGNAMTTKKYRKGKDLCKMNHKDRKGKMAVVKNEGTGLCNSCEVDFYSKKRKKGGNLSLAVWEKARAVFLNGKDEGGKKDPAKTAVKKVGRPAKKARKVKSRQAPGVRRPTAVVELPSAIQSAVDSLIEAIVKTLQSGGDQEQKIEAEVARRVAIEKKNLKAQLKTLFG